LDDRNIFVFDLDDFTLLELVNLLDHLVLVDSFVLIDVVHRVDLHNRNVRYELTFLLLLRLYIVCEDDRVVSLGCDNTTGDNFRDFGRGT